jgi:hypothetical protein
MKRFNWKQTGLVALTLGTMVSAASAQNGVRDGVRVRINGQPFRTQVAPVTENGRVLVPMRAIFEELGARVDYNSDRTIVARRDGTVVRMTLGRARAFVNEEPVRLDAPARSFDGRTMVPLRFVSEALGANVDYDSYRQLVTIEAGDGRRGVDRPLRDRDRPLRDRPLRDGDRPLRDRDRDGDGVPNREDAFPDNSRR